MNGTDGPARDPAAGGPDTDGEPAARRLPSHDAARSTAHAGVFAELGLTVLERGWLSSNNIVFRGDPARPASVVDTGYASHAEQTLLLLDRALDGAELGLVVNTHLHSDHCGGNAALQARWKCETWVPEASFDAVRDWDPRRLTFDLTDQRCERFGASGAFAIGQTIRLGGHDWNVIAAPGHDPEAAMLFQPDSRVLISGDALWESRLAIVFPELAGEPGFDDVRVALDRIEELDPRFVIPGHGPPFGNVRDALHASRRRLRQFSLVPQQHLEHAVRALTMFHMLEHRHRSRAQLVAWLAKAPIFLGLLHRLRGDGETVDDVAAAAVDRLVASGQLVRDGELVAVR